MQLQDNEVNKILQGNALEVLKTLPAKSVDMVITSPPYWALRDYSDATETIWGADDDCEHSWGEDVEIKQMSYPKDYDKAKFGTGKSCYCKKCGSWKGQLGMEPTPQLYIQHLIQIFDEVKRVLKDTGTVWANLGDTFSGGVKKDTDFEEKCLLQIPARFAIAMCEKGWILRNEIIWEKSNFLYSSVQDRFTINWEKIFFFAKKPRYFFNQQFEPYTEIDKRTLQGLALADEKVDGAGKWCGQGNPMGKNHRAIFKINTKPNSFAHFAVYPEKLLEVPIDAGCPEFVCSRCGEPREKIWEIDRTNAEKQIFKETVNMPEGEYKKATGFTRTVSDIFDYCLGAERRFVGWRECGCKEEFRPGIVLDIFAGSGTTAVVAQKMGRRWLGIEINPAYITIAQKRINELPKRLDSFFGKRNDDVFLGQENGREDSLNTTNS
jgi:DNA modification methylase